MSKPEFAEAVETVTLRDPRYSRDAYYFLKDALNHTVKLGRKGRQGDGSGHVSGQQLLSGIRQYALKQFGPMVVTVFEYWGVRRCEDFGEMVYNLIRIGVFGKTESDSIDDFKDGYNFKEAFVDPYLPEPIPVRRRVRVGRPAKELN